MMAGAFAVLKKDSPFHSLFPAGWVPIFPLSPDQQILAGKESPVYLLDVNRCTEFQIRQLSVAVAKTRGGTAEKVRAFLEADRRLPLQISDVVRVEYLGQRPRDLSADVADGRR
jgi:hypothetical protein